MCILHPNKLRLAVDQDLDLDPIRDLVLKLGRYLLLRSLHELPDLRDSKPLSQSST